MSWDEMTLICWLYTSKTKDGCKFPCGAEKGVALQIMWWHSRMVSSKIWVSDYTIVPNDVYIMSFNMIVISFEEDIPQIIICNITTNLVEERINFTTIFL